ncbi:MAG: hypothetical protein L0206_17920, partial [Actinobacteria bacterium]|nr:hypothetical protein [Actinomycetota bacterium]
MALELLNGQSPPLRDGHPRSVTALGIFAPFPAGWYYGARNLTQEVVYHSRDPEIAIATNEDGNRSRIVGVAPGCARIYAEDPATGITSPAHVLCNLGQLTGLALGGPRLFYPHYAIPMGATVQIDVWGVYESGSHFRLDRKEPTSYVLESTDLSVLAVSADGHAVVAVGPGRASVTARHLAGGFISSAIEIPVQGTIDRLRITPAAITRAIGESEEYTVFGLSAPAYEDLLTQLVEYRSSDPSVAVASNEPPRRSVV